MGIDDFVIAGRRSGSVEWQAPKDEGEYSIYCTDCKLKDQFFTVHVAASAAEFHRPAPVVNAVDVAM
jgi:hypothetical protein